MRAAPVRRAALVAGVLLAVGAGAGGLLLARGDDDGPTATEATEGAQAVGAQPTATIERRDLVDTVEADGTLGYGEARPVRGSGGTVTSLPEPGTVVEAGQPLYGVDGHAGPIVLPGDLPMWRTIESGIDDGPDVAQLEAVLAAAGHADEDMTVDQEVTYSTIRAIEAWQEAHGLEETGRIEPGDVWFAPGAVRIASTTARVGDPAEGEILSLTGTTRHVHVDLEVRDSQDVTEGDTVDLELADGTETTGTVTSVSDVATVAGGEGEGEEATTTVAVEITPDGEVEALDQSPVEVSFARDAVEGALAVPLEAVVATGGGGFALEVVGDGGTTALVAVELGRLADGWIQVTGDVAEGQTVVTA